MLVLVATSLVGQTTATDHGPVLAVGVEGWLPGIIEPDSGLVGAIGAAAQISLLHTGRFSLFARGGLFSIATDANTSLFYMGAAAGGQYTIGLGDRADLFASASAGLGRLPDVGPLGHENQSYGLYEVGARLGMTWLVSAATRIGAFAGYQRLAAPGRPFLDAPAAGVGVWISPTELLRSRGRVQIVAIDAEPVFPVLRAWYDNQPVGSVTVRNLEDGPIDRVHVFFRVPDYMGGARLCLTVPRLERGAQVDVPLYALFDERILTLTEHSSSIAEVSVEYSFFGRELTTRETFPLRIYHRNTMTWVDDRRAAAFVSPTDPSALWFARSATAIARDRLRATLPRNLQHAASIFEALRLYGVNYVIDPNSSYIELSENASAIDFLQYPGETLSYRGGDCDDLSILYASLLESTGISTAFITIPGHIYVAFDLGITQEEALDQFFDPGLLLMRDGRAWAPIEVTMVPEGFVKAWRVGAKQWVDNEAAGAADFFTMRDNWLHYPPSALADAAARFDLPEESALMAAFDQAMDRFIVREIAPVIGGFEARLARSRDPAVLNDYGAALANAGLLDEAWERFAESADAGYPWAWNNLANIAFIRKEYDLAHSYYEWAENLLPGDPVAVLGLARADYETDRYRAAEAWYATLTGNAPLLAERFGYLSSVYGGVGRAWSMADRLASTVWSRPGLDFMPAPAVVIAQPAPQPDPQPAPAVVAPPVVLARPAPQPEPDPAPVVAPQPAPAPVPPEPEPLVTEQSPRPEPRSQPEPAPIVAAPPPAPPVVSAPPQPPPQPEPAPIVAAPVVSAPPPVVSAPPPPAPPVVSAAPPPQPAPQPAPALPPAVRPTAPRDADIAAAQERASPPVVAAQPAPQPAPTPPPAVRPTAPRDADITAAELRASPPVAPPAVAERAPVDPDIANAESRDVSPESTVTPQPAEETVAPRSPLFVAPQAVAAVSGARVDAPPVLSRGPAEAPQPTVGFSERTELDQGVVGGRVGTRADARTIQAATTVGHVSFLSPGVYPAVGDWTLGHSRAQMTDRSATYAKLVVPHDHARGPTRYSVRARSTGFGRVGFGVHIHGRGEWRHSWYGGGDSILVWITSDPNAYGDAAPRLQIYRSRGEVDMTLIESVVIDGSVLTLREYSVDYDPVAGTLGVQVDGTTWLSTRGLVAPAYFGFTILRAFDAAEFSDLSIRPIDGYDARGIR
ncbi:MAG: hypothetical protein EA382_06240 [Spirochaetaceae bacterium]|nr:MAG: hypothetical protein EA382_06240 [Spirochaetaceae bacterium]